MFKLNKKIYKRTIIALASVITSVTFISYKSVLYDLDDDQNYLNNEALIGQNKNNARNFIFSPRINEYITLHSSIIAKARTRGNVFFCQTIKSGYGNRLYTFISSMLVSLLSNSALIIQNWDEAKAYVNLPFNPFFKTNESNDLNDEFEPEKIYQFHSRNMWRCEKDLDEKVYIPNEYTRFRFQTYSALFMELSANDLFYDRILEFNLASTETIARARSALKKTNSNKSQRLDYLLQVGFEVGGNILNQLWIPNSSILDYVDYFYNKEFKGYYVIGFQLRFEYLENEAKKDINKFLKCAMKIEKDYIRSNALNTKQLKQIKWFITSDSEEYVNKILKSFPTKAMASNGTIKHIKFSTKGYRRTIVDVELLSRSDEIIITGGSTYGFVASMKSLKLSYYVNGKSSSDCSRISLSSPPRTPKNTCIF